MRNIYSLFTFVLLTMFSLFATHSWAQTGPTVFSDTICSGETATLTVSPQAGKTYSWYDAQSGGNLLATGDTLVTGPLTSTTTFYLTESSGAGIQTGVGAPNNSIAGGTNYSAFGDGLVFTALDTVTIDTVFVYPNGPGNVVINHTTSNGSVINTVTVPVTTTGKTAIPLGFCVLPGTGYRMNAVGTTTGGLFRNTGGAVYPYTSSLVNITGAINTSTTFYYFFYDWKLTSGCGGGPPVTVPVTATVNPNPTVNLGQDTSICDGSNLVIQASGGASYLWSTGSTVSSILVDSAGSYWVVCTDGNGCSGRDTIGIGVNSIPNPGIPDDTTSCGGSAVTICAQTGTGLSFLWSNGDTSACTNISTAGNYSVTVIDNGSGCTVSDTTSLDAVPLPDAGFSIDTSGCPLIVFNSTGAGSQFAWDYGDGGTGAGASSTYTYGGNGNYSVMLTAFNQCGADSVSQNLAIGCLVGISDEIENEIQLYPNPNLGSFSLKYPARSDRETFLRIMDSRGGIVLEKNIQGQMGHVNLSGDFEVGMYFLELKQGDKIWTRRFMVGK